MATIQLGDKVRDRVTGLVGVVITLSKHINWCERAIIQPAVEKEGKVPDSFWVDLPSLELLEDGSAMRAAFAEGRAALQARGPAEIPTGGPSERLPPERAR